MLARVAMLLLVVVTVITGVTAEWLVSSIEGLVETGGVSEQFVALILLPLVGNAAEHVTVRQLFSTPCGREMRRDPQHECCNSSRFSIRC